MADPPTRYRRRMVQRLHITYAADVRRLSRRFENVPQYEMQLHYHRVAVRWLERRARRRGWEPIPGTDWTFVAEEPGDYLAHRLTGRVQLDCWADEPEPDTGADTSQGDAAVPSTEEHPAT